MKEIGWANFYEIVRNKFASVKCPIKKALHTQLLILADGQPWDSFIEQARSNAPVAWNTESKSFKDNLGRGSGDLTMTVALYFWLHTTEGLKSYASEIDKVAFEQDFEEEFNDLRLPVTRKLGEFGPSMAYKHNLPAALPEGEVQALRDFLENTDPSNQKYPTLVRLTFEIEQIMDSQATRLHGSDSVFTFRNSLAQSNWLSPEEIEAISHNSLDWRTRIKEYGDFAKLVDGHNYVLVREDGTRVTSAALHSINSWFGCLWKLLLDEIIEPRDLDLFLRYILVFAQYERSRYLKFYFNDDAGKIDYVFQKAIERIHQRDLDLRDYNPIDDQYRQYFFSILKK